MITFKHVTKSFNNWKILDNISFNVKKGDFLFLVGHSGSGKTTILKHIYNDLKCDTGTITVDGIDISNSKESSLPKLRQKLGVVFQEHRLLMDRTVFENVALPLRICRVREKLIKRKVLKTLCDMGLSHKSTEYPSKLSGGESQRVCLARAIINDPMVLLADEPTGNLDSENEHAIFELIKNVHNKGTTVLMATHNSNLIKESGKEELRLEHGKIINPSQ